MTLKQEVDAPASQVLLADKLLTVRGWDSHAETFQLLLSTLQDAARL
jgi:hypothetical protein